MDGIAVNGPDIGKDGLKPCKWLKIMSKIFEKYFQTDKFIDRMDYSSSFLHQIVATPQNHLKSISLLFRPSASEVLE